MLYSISHILKEFHWVKDNKFIYLFIYIYIFFFHLIKKKTKLKKKSELKKNYSIPVVPLV